VRQRFGRTLHLSNSDLRLSLSGQVEARCGRVGLLDRMHVDSQGTGSELIGPICRTSESERVLGYAEGFGQPPCSRHTMRMRVSTRFHAKAAPEAPAPTMSTSTVSVTRISRGLAALGITVHSISNTSSWLENTCTENAGSVKQTGFRVVGQFDLVAALRDAAAFGWAPQCERRALKSRTFSRSC